MTGKTYEDADYKLADTMSSYWANFAKTGDPNGEDLPKWPAYNRQDEPYLELGDSPKAGQHLLEPQLDFHEQQGSRKQAERSGPHLPARRLHSRLCLRPCFAKFEQVLPGRNVAPFGPLGVEVGQFSDGLGVIP